MTRLLLIFGALAGFAWAGLVAIEAMGLFTTLPIFRETAQLVAYGLTAIVAILALSVLLLDAALPSIFSVRPSGLFRTVTTITLSFLVSSILLSRLGIDVGAILTTSAILGAIIGLALQPTLGSLFSGMALVSVHNLKAGSTLVFDGDWVVVESTHWRHVVGRALDGSEVFIPNALLAQSMFSIFPEDRATRFDVFLHLPSDVPPQQVTDALVGAFTDIEHLDATKPVKVVPYETQPDQGSIVYRICLYARDYGLISDLKGEVLRRSWYVLDRIGVCQPHDCNFEKSGWEAPSLGALLAQTHPNIKESERGAIQDSAHLHRFAPMEILRFPATEAGRVALVLQGHVSEGTDQFLNPVEHGLTSVPYLPTIPSYRLAEAAHLRRVADRLAQDVGPVAEKLIRRAIRSKPDRTAFLDKLATHIPGVAAREAFLSDTRGLVIQENDLGPGMTALLMLDATGRVSTQPDLRAMTEVTVATFAEDAVAALLQASSQIGQPGQTGL